VASLARSELYQEVLREAEMSKAGCFDTHIHLEEINKIVESCPVTWNLDNGESMTVAWRATSVSMASPRKGVSSTPSTFDIALSMGKSYEAVVKVEATLTRLSRTGDVLKREVVSDLNMLSFHLPVGSCIDQRFHTAPPRIPVGLMIKDCMLRALISHQAGGPPPCPLPFCNNSKQRGL
jgi:hypothetical protein